MCGFSHLCQECGSDSTRASLSAEARPPGRATPLLFAWSGGRGHWGGRLHNTESSCDGQVLLLTVYKETVQMIWDSMFSRPQLPLSCLVSLPSPETKAFFSWGILFPLLASLRPSQQQQQGCRVNQPVVQSTAPWLIICRVQVTKKRSSEVLMGFSFPKQLSPGQQITVVTET